MEVVLKYEEIVHAGQVGWMRHLGRWPWGTLNSNDEQLLENEH